MRTSTLTWDEKYIYYCILFEDDIANCGSTNVSNYMSLILWGNQKGPDFASKLALQRLCFLAAENMHARIDKAANAKVMQNAQYITSQTVTEHRLTDSPIAT